MNTATDHARALVAALVRLGLEHVVVCPGSRSAPLAYALYDAAEGGRPALHVRHDERVAGFTALGIGKATGRPAAVVTTSGTAVVNLHPAVLEAHHAGVPLLVLAADRPPRIRGTWANQTSDLQAEAFGRATRYATDLSPDADVATWDTAAVAAFGAATGETGGRPGPVLLNLGFDDPLVPDDAEPWTPEGSAWTPEGSAHTGGFSAGTPEAAPTQGAGVGLVERARSRRTVVVAGDGAGVQARPLAVHLGLPLLAEPTSGARGGPSLVAAYRILLDHPELGGRIEHVIAFGRPTLSRPVTRLLARSEVTVDLVLAHPEDPRPERSDVAMIDAAVVGAALEVPTGAVDDRVAEWSSAWRRASSVAAVAVDRVLDGWPVLTGPLVAREVAAATGPADSLVLAASNPVRDVDLAGRGWDRPPYVVANRGVSGIDGTISTAMGVALGRGPKSTTRVLVGDVALLHDLGALVLGPDERRPDLMVVVVNDAGGGIFSLLEPGIDADRDDWSAARFERMFGTPHSVRLAEVCAGLGVPHAAVASTAGLRERLSVEPRGISVLEVAVDRADLRPLHEAIRHAVTVALEPPA